MNAAGKWTKLHHASHENGLHTGLPWYNGLGNFLGEADLLDDYTLVKAVQKWDGIRPPVSACQKAGRILKAPSSAPNPVAAAQFVLVAQLEMWVITVSIRVLLVELSQ